MLDDLRNSDGDKNSFPENIDDAELEPLLHKKPKPSGLGFKFNSKNFLGMNAFQRFVISALLFSMVCVLGAMLLMISGSIAF